MSARLRFIPNAESTGTNTTYTVRCIIVSFIVGCANSRGGSRETSNFQRSREADFDCRDCASDLNPPIRHSCGEACRCWP